MHNPGFEQKYEKYQNFLSETFTFLVVKFLIYLNRRVSIMKHAFWIIEITLMHVYSFSG